MIELINEPNNMSEDLYLQRRQTTNVKELRKGASINMHMI